MEKSDRLLLNVCRLLLKVNRLLLKVARPLLKIGRLLFKVGRPLVKVGHLLLKVVRLLLKAGCLLLKFGRPLLKVGRPLSSEVFWWWTLKETICGWAKQRQSEKLWWNIWKNWKSRKGIHWPCKCNCSRIPKIYQILLLQRAGKISDLKSSLT